MKNIKPEIFFHVGLGKNASTYLQYKFFPKLKGIKYIQRTEYKYYKKIIDNSEYDKYFFSREFDRQLEKETKEFSSIYPHAKTIIILRRHDSWIASQYRRFVKNGGNCSFNEFIDIEKDNGLWKMHDLYFFDKILHLENHFEPKPFILFHEDLKNDPYFFFNKIAKYTKTEYDKNSISLKPFHRSYNEKQLKYMRRWGQKYIWAKRSHYKNNVHKWISEKTRLHYCHILLLFANFMPSNPVKDDILIPKDYQLRIKEYFNDDWQKCIEYAQKNNKV